MEKMKDREANIEEKAMNQIFDFENSKPDQGRQLLRQARHQGNLRIAAISSLIALFVLSMAGVLKLQIAPWLLNRETLAQSLHSQIYGANLYLGPWQEEVGLFNSGAQAIRYRWVADHPIYEGQVSAKDNLELASVNLGKGEDWTQFQNALDYSYFGQRVMKFYHPSLVYPQYATDFTELNQLADDQWVELGLSFDQSYTLAELQAKLPQGVKLNWCWVDGYDPLTLEGLGAKEGEFAALPTQILLQDQVMGFSLIWGNGAPKEQPQQNFLQDLELGRQRGGSYKEAYQKIQNTLQAKDPQMTGTALPIIGAVVTGSKADLLQLRQWDFIRATSLGAVVAP